MCFETRYFKHSLRFLHIQVNKCAGFANYPNILNIGSLSEPQEALTSWVSTLSGVLQQLRAFALWVGEMRCFGDEGNAGVI